MSFDPKFYLSMVVRRLPAVIAILVATTLLGLLWAYVAPPVYRAEARLLVESPQIPDELAASTVRSSPAEILLSIQERLLTKTNLMALSNEFGIHEGLSLAEDSIVADMRARLQMTLPPLDTRTGVVIVSFDADDPEQSASVTNALVKQILDENVELRTGASGGTLSFFEQEVERLSTELAAQNARILEFEQANRNALPESMEYRRSRQSAQQERLLQVDRELASLRDRRQRLADLYDRTGRLGPTAEDLTPEQAQLEELRQELASALVIYAPGNARVRALQTQVAALEEVVRQQMGGGTGEGALSTFELQIADIDAQIDFLAVQKSQLEVELADLEASLRATPANALVLGELRSDFENLRVQYDQAVQSLSEARMGDRIEVTARGQRISVIDPAIAPSEPAAPNRKLVVAAGFGAGLVLTAAWLFLLDVLNTTVRRPSELVSALGITPFGTVPYLATPAELHHRKQIMVTGIVTGVIALALLLALVLFVLSTAEAQAAVAPDAAETGAVALTSR